MKIKMPSGVILECDNDSINQSRLKQGGIAIKNQIETPLTEEPKKVTKKKSNK